MSYDPSLDRLLDENGNEIKVTVTGSSTISWEWVSNGQVEVPLIEPNQQDTSE